MLEHFLITHSAPTLAGLKTANLFNYTIPPACDLNAQLRLWNQTLAPRGVSLTTLAQTPQRALIYVCRKNRLRADWQAEGVAEFLAALRYDCTNVESSLTRLRQRIAHSNSFPHEIGLFLGYPLADVVGFIENGGQNYRCCGCWKVYCDPMKAERLFAKFRACTKAYTQLYHQGKSVMQLTIAA